jgi:hypothetical protein
VRRAAKRDANEPQLIKQARQVGWVLIKLDIPCDWLGIWRGKWYPVEIKAKKGVLTDAQKQFIATASWYRAPVLIWRTLEDVLESSK